MTAEPRPKAPVGRVQETNRQVSEGSPRTPQTSGHGSPIVPSRLASFHWESSAIGVVVRPACGCGQNGMVLSGPSARDTLVCKARNSNNHIFVHFFCFEQLSAMPIRANPYLRCEAFRPQIFSSVGGSIILDQDQPITLAAATMFDNYRGRYRQVHRHRFFSTSTMTTKPGDIMETGTGVAASDCDRCVHAEPFKNW